MKPDLVSVVSPHVVCFYAFTHSENIPKYARELGAGCMPFHSGINGLTLTSNFK